MARNMPRTIHRILAALTALALSSAAAARPALTWTLLNVPPFTIPVNGLPTDGIMDQVLRLLMQELPQYEARYAVVNIARAIKMLDVGEPACYTAAIPTPERERRYFSTLTTLNPPLQVVVRASMLGQLPRNEAGEVLIERLLVEHRLRGLVVDQRSYTPALDVLLAKYRASAGLVTVSSSNVGSNVLRMLSAGRADYSLEHDAVLAYNQAGNPQGLGREALVSVPIAGLSPLYSAILCPRTAWGRERIIAIDAALSRMAQGKAYRALLDRWRTPQTVQHYRAAFDEFYRARATPNGPEHYPLP